MKDTLKLTRVHIDEARYGSTSEVTRLSAGHPTPEVAARLDEIAARSLDEPHYYDGESACWRRAYVLQEVHVVEPPQRSSPPGFGRHELDLKTAQDLIGPYDIAELHEDRLVTRHIRVIYDSVADYLDRVEATDAGREGSRSREVAQDISSIDTERNAREAAHAHQA